MERVLHGCSEFSTINPYFQEDTTKSNASVDVEEVINSEQLRLSSIPSSENQKPRNSYPFYIS